MSKVYYQKADPNYKRRLVRLLGIALSITGLFTMLYIFMPLLLWQLTLAPVFASQNITVPIPKKTVVNKSTIQSLIAASFQNLQGVDYTNADNWFPGYTSHPNPQLRTTSYFLSIPKLHITNAYVSAIDNDLAKHLVHFGGTALPPDKGTAVIFGHSTLPQLFDVNNYRTIFANLYTMQVGDKIFVTVDNVKYTYKIYAMTVIDPEDVSVLTQNYDDSYLNIITCTPPGTIWKRLVVQSRLEQL